MSRVVGIDFGTTNTVVAADFEAKPQSLESGEPILPSVVAFPPSGVTLVGSSARRRRAIDPRNTIFSTKRLLGRSWTSTETKDVRALYPFDLVKSGDGNIAYKTRAGFLTPIDVASTILAAAVRGLDATIADSNYVISVPSRFGDTHRVALGAAAAMAGLEDVRVVDEPMATAMAYLSVTADPDGYAAVFDLGGGTFDLALLDCRRGRDDCSEQPFQLVGHGGDLHLGGDDIDHAIANWAAEEIARAQRWDLRDDPVVFDRLVIASERAKIQLCTDSEARIELSAVDPASPVATRYLVLEQALLESLTLDLVYRTFVICDAVLAEAGVRAADVSAVFLAGGSTKLPMVRDAVARYFDCEPHAELDPMHVVALGASLAE